MSTCIKCSKPLSNDEIGIHKKLINRGAVNFYCKMCLANYFDCSVDLIDDKIKQYKEMGCTLFSKK